MKKHYFAGYNEVLCMGHFFVAVFEDKETRDKWVAFQDSASIRYGETEANCQLHRIALDDEEAECCLKILESSDCHREEDLGNDNMFWIS